MDISIKKGQNAGKIISEVLSKASGLEAITFDFETSDYYFSENDCFILPYAITNATTYKPSQPPIRKIGVLLQNAKNVTLKGNGSTLWFEGIMTEFVVDGCENILIEDFILNFVHPTVFEFDVVERTWRYVDILPQKDCLFQLDKHRFRLPFERLPKGKGTIMQIYREDDESTHRLYSLSRARGSIFRRQLGAKEMENGIIRIFLPFSKLKKGFRYQLSNPFRDGVGTFIQKSQNVTLKNNTYRFMHGLGIAAQMSRNVTVKDCNFVPDRERGITTCGTADMIHASMMQGMIEIRNCNFEGARDDVINIHGIHFKIVRIDGVNIWVRFSQVETYGFLAFDSGDKIEIVDPRSLLKIGDATVKEAALINPKLIRLTLDKKLPKKMKRKVVENITRTCDLLVDNIHCKHIPTRGILVTTRGKVVIQNNTFYHLPMANILIADDARGWYESGPVSNVTIRNNQFIRCGAFPIDIYPEANSKSPIPIHRNISVSDNQFVLDKSNRLFRIKRTDGFSFFRNQITSNGDPVVKIIDCINTTMDL